MQKLSLFLAGRHAEPLLIEFDGHSQSDCLFRKNSLTILIENKIIREGKKEECNIKNAMVQTIEYLKPL